MGSGAVIVPIVIGMVASKVVTKITGSELLGALAGMGAGSLFSPGGIMGETATALGEAGAAGATGSTVAGGSEMLGAVGMDPGNGLAGAFTSMASEAAPVVELSTLAGGAPVTELSSNLASNAVQSGGGGNLLTSAGNALSKGTEWVGNNPLAASMGFSALSSMAGQEGLEEQREFDEEQAALDRAQREGLYGRETVDPNDVRSFNAVNKNLADEGYVSQYQTLMEQGPSPVLAGPVLPNYKRMIERYKRGGENA